MAIRQVEIDDYGKAEMQRGKLVVREFAGMLVLSIKNDDGTTSTVQVSADDVWRAWQAVKRY